MYKRMKTLILSVCLVSLGSSCSRYYLTCDKQQRNQEYLASSFTKSPDPTKVDLIKGEQLVVAWHVPRSFENKATCNLDLTYWDYTQESLSFIIKDRLGQFCVENLGPEFQKNKGIIAYKAVLKDPEGKVYQTWTHQLYTELINVSEEEAEIDEDPVKVDEDPWDWESSL
jgi:hypothetical protein